MRYPTEYCLNCQTADGMRLASAEHEIAGLKEKVSRLTRIVFAMGALFLLHLQDPTSTGTIMKVLKQILSVLH